MLQAQCGINVTNDSGSKNITFNFVHSIEIESSYENLTDTCKITIPRKLTFEGIPLFTGDNPIFKRGDKIEVSIGYVPNITKVFSGYIKTVGSNVPTVLECEDGMYLLKQYTVNYPSKKALDEVINTLKVHPATIPLKVKLDELLDFCLTPKGIEYEVVDNIDLGSFRVINASPAMVLDKLKSEYGLYSYFRDGILHVGFANDASVTSEAELKMEEVVINSDTLEWSRSEDVRLKCVAISIFPDNTKSDPIEFGDADGNQITIHKYNMDSKSLEFAAKEWIAENKYTGYKGEIETFGEPIIKHGDRVKLTSVKLPERDGTFLVKKVKRIYSVDSGNHQVLTLGAKVG
jgi:hypothetical protein